jgi:hypothetical protein
MRKRCFVNFNSHFALAGKHAFLSPSQYAWINYDEQKLEARYISSRQARRGTALHDLAHNAILLGVKLAKSNRELATYVNDAIGYKMTSEQPLYYSDNCFGTPDTIAFRRKKLRIHDLKTGISRASDKQLKVYAALFCLEYNIVPFEIETELRIYQNDDIAVYEADPNEINRIMGTIIEWDMRIEFMKERDML